MGVKNVLMGILRLLLLQAPYGQGIAMHAEKIMVALSEKEMSLRNVSHLIAFGANQSMWYG